MKYILFDLKRTFEKKSLIIICVISPVIVMLLFGSIVAPLLFTAKITKFNVAIVNDDKSKEVNTFIDQLVNSKALKDLVVSYPAQSIEDGYEMLEKNEVLVLIHIPEGLMSSIKTNKKTNIELYSIKGHYLESELIKMTLESSLSTVAKGQNLLEYSIKFISDKSISLEKIKQFTDEITDKAIREFMNRREVLSQAGTLSPIGAYIPIEYYTGIIFTFFAALAMLPISAMTAEDMRKNVLKRGFLYDRRYLGYYFGRLISGTALICLILLLVYPSYLLNSILNTALKVEFTSNAAALFLSVLLSALCFSAMAVTVSSIFSKGNMSIWILFYIILFMAVLSGAVIPTDSMPEFASKISGWMPFRAAMRSMINALFIFDVSQYFQEVIKLIIWNIVFIASGLLFIRKRAMK